MHSSTLSAYQLCILAFKLNKIIKTLVQESVKEVTLLGKVTKEWLYKEHVMPDLRAIKLLNRLRKQNFKDDTTTVCPRSIAPIILAASKPNLISCHCLSVGTLLVKICGPGISGFKYFV